MHIAVIGSGRVGSLLGKRWAAAGHHVTFGVRDPAHERVQAIIATARPNVRAARMAQVARDAEVVVLATPWEATLDALAAMGDLTGKVLVDCTNPIREGFVGLAIGTTTSAAEQIAIWAPGARVIKAFNTTGAANMANPRYPTGPLAMYFCGDDADAKATVSELIEALGFAPVDAGPLTAARYLEPLAMLWIHLAYRQGFGPEFGLTLVRRA